MRTPTTATGSQAGFTLIEMLMAILIAGILARVAMSVYVDFSKDAKIAVTNQRLVEIKMALLGDARSTASGKFSNTGFIAQVGSVPTGLNDLVTQGTYTAYSPFTGLGWNGPYVNSKAEPNWNKDAWGIAFQYNSVTRTITSCGPDKTCGTSDDISVTF